MSESTPMTQGIKVMDTGVTVVNPAQTVEFTGSEAVSNPAPGKATVNITGGGGMTTLAATEKPNGVLKVFTFSGASAQPSFLRIDGALKPATDSDTATINWTWNNGAKQATTTFPPQTDVAAIV